MKWFRHVVRPFLVPYSRIPLPIQFCGNPRRSVGWPELLSLLISGEIRRGVRRGWMRY